MSNISVVNQKTKFNHRKVLSATLLSILLVLASAGIIYQAAVMQQQYLLDNTFRQVNVNCSAGAFNVSTPSTIGNLSVASINMTSTIDLSEAPTLTTVGWSNITFNPTMTVGLGQWP